MGTKSVRSKLQLEEDMEHLQYSNRKRICNTDNTAAGSRHGSLATLQKDSHERYIGTPADKTDGTDMT